MTEDEFLSALRGFPLVQAARGLADDAAVLEVINQPLVVTHDMLVEGVHVLTTQDPADVAWKLVAVNLSDLAAKGARPLGVLIGHTLGTGDDRFLTGLNEVLTQFDVPLLGGDTVSANGPRTWGCTAIGVATHRPVPTRSGARPGDTVYVTGPLGAAMLGFEALRDSSGADSSAYRRPQPRLAEGIVLAPHATAMMDVSDGLLLDAWRMATASGVTFAIDTASVRVADPRRAAECLRWGDDYELLFTAPSDAKLAVPAHPIGSVDLRGEAPLICDGIPYPDSAGLGYQHG